MAFSKKYSDYLIDVDVTNYKQLSPGDIVAVTMPGWKDLKKKQKLVRGATIGAAVGVVTFGAGTAFGALGSGAFGGLSVGAEVIAAAGAGAGAAGGYVGGEVWNQVANLKLDSVNMVGRVIDIDNKILQDSKHIQVKFYVPQRNGSFEEDIVWIDAHHLFKLITKEKDQEIRTKVEAEVKQKTEEFRKEVYDQAYTSAITTLEESGLIPKDKLVESEKNLENLKETEKNLLEKVRTSLIKLTGKEVDLDNLHKQKHDSEVGHWTGHSLLGLVILIILL